MAITLLIGNPPPPDVFLEPLLQELSLPLNPFLFRR